MKRYIELVYDNSSSMTGIIHSQQKWQIVLELFEKDILPHIGRPGDHVVLRELGNNCAKGSSKAEVLPNDKKDMLRILQKVSYNNFTPLFYSIFDAIEACKNTKADEHLVFILTDGDDTCQVPLLQLIDKETIERYVIDFQVLLVQFAVDTPESSRNLFALASFLNCRSIAISSSDTIPQMRTKLKESLITSGFAKKQKLEYCFTNKSGPMVTWEQAKAEGITFHRATVLYNKSELKWEPNKDVDIHPLDYAELKFVHKLYFENGLNEDAVRAMLKQLKKPYYYDFKCIYWDFSTSEWRYHQKQNTVDFIDNPKAIEADRKMMAPVLDNISLELANEMPKEYFTNHQYYKVTLLETRAPSFVLEPIYMNAKPKNTLVLKNDTIVEFQTP